MVDSTERSKTEVRVVRSSAILTHDDPVGMRNSVRKQRRSRLRGRLVEWHRPLRGGSWRPAQRLGDDERGRGWEESESYHNFCVNVLMYERSYEEKVTSILAYLYGEAKHNILLSSSKGGLLLGMDATVVRYVSAL